MLLKLRPWYSAGRTKVAGSAFMSGAMATSEYAGGGACGYVAQSEIQDAGGTTIPLPREPADAAPLAE